jgi:hypothetical protein
MSDHLSEDQMCRAIAGQPTIEELRHLAGCAVCRAEVDRAGHVLRAFRGAMTAWAEREAGRAAMDVGARAHAGVAWSSALGTAALVAACSLLIWQVRAGPSGPAGVEPWREAAAVSALDGGPGEPVVVASEFLPLAYSTVPVTGGHIVRLEVPSASLGAFGVDLADTVSPRPDAVLADIIVGEDGLARAVRFVRPLGNQSVQKERVP